MTLIINDQGCVLSDGFAIYLRERLLSDRFGNWSIALPRPLLDRLCERVEEELFSYVHQWREEQDNEELKELATDYANIAQDLEDREKELAEWKARRPHGLLRP